MEGIKWPVDKCEHCGYDLTEVIPRPSTKALSEDGSGKPMWSDHCPQCGKGYIVGERGIPVPRGLSVKVISSQAEILATAPGEREAKAKLKKAQAPALAPENLYSPDTDKTHELHRSLRPSEYWCTKCACVHREKSKQGTRHLKYKEA